VVTINPSWSKTNENRIVVRSLSSNGSDWDLWIIDLNDLDHPVNVTNTTSTREFNPSWSPDDSQIVFCSEPAGSGVTSIEVVNADGSGRHVISTEQRSVYPAWRRNP
jgi:Tol biopolymer transport system component